MDTQKPKWLENIQYNSWEPELFISGGAIFTLLQIPTFLHNYSILLLQETGFYEAIIIAEILIVAVNGLIAGFTIHLILRGFWIGMVCLSYVFPSGIQKEKIESFAPRFKKQIDGLRQMTDFVIVLEKACSIVFSLSFLFFLVALGILVVGLALIPHSSLESTLGAQVYLILQMAALFVGGLGFIYLIDFFLMGAIKRIHGFSKIYYPIYVFFSFLTFSFLYRNAYYTFITNVKKWQSIVGMSSFLIVSIGITVINGGVINQYQDARFYLQLKDSHNEFLHSHYDNQRLEKQLIQTASIQSDFIDNDDFLKLFIVHRKQFEPYMDTICGNLQDLSIDEDKLMCFSTFYQVKINEGLIEPIKWRRYQHPITKEKGMMGVIDLSSYPRGEAFLEVTLNFPSSIQEQTFTNGVYARIPFWKK